MAALDPRVEPGVHELDGFAVTFWTFYPPTVDAVPPASYAAALRRLHVAMRGVRVEAPHFTERVAEAEQLLTHPDETPALSADDRHMLLATLRDAAAAIHSRGVAEQLLHGEPHRGNLLATASGPRFIDFETCCRGPVEFDVAHAPDEVATHYADLDHELLQQCRRLILAMVAAWRWDVRDEFPDGHGHGRTIVRLLRDGPPWPSLDALPTD